VDFSLIKAAKSSVLKYMSKQSVVAVTKYLLENCPSRMTGKSKVAIKKHIFIGKCKDRI
jgi:hypothetical protein